MDHKTLYNKTPMLLSQRLSEITGKQVFLKMECYQPTGSFKIRGLSTLCIQSKQEGYEHFVSSSGGNAGYTTAYIGKQLGVQTTVFVPEGIPKVYKNAIASLDANILSSGSHFDKANQAAIAFAQEHHAAYIPPFEHPLIWTGHSTVIDEILSSQPQVEAIITAVGGGGLLCGLAEGLIRHQRQDIHLLGVEPVGAAALEKTLRHGRVFPLERVDTIASTLAVKSISAQVLSYPTCQIEPSTATDKDALDSIIRFADDHRALVEPACGFPLSVLYNNSPAIAQYKNICVIVCGGIGISTDLLTKIGH